MNENQIFTGNRLAMRLTIWFMALSFIVLIALVRFNKVNIRTSLLETQGKQQQLLAQNMASAAQIDGPANAISQFQTMGSDQSQFAIILDGDGNLIAQSHPGAFHFPGSITSRFFEKPVGYLIDEKDGQVLGFAALENGNVVVTSYPISSITQLTEQLSGNLWLQLAVSMLIISIIGGIIVWLIVGLPLRQFTEAAGSLSRGELNTRINTQGLDNELAIMANTFNTMAIQIESHIANMEKVLEIGKKVASIVDFRKSLKAIHQGVQNGLGFDHVKLYLYDEETQTMTLAVDTYISEELIEDAAAPVPVAEMPIFQQVIMQHSGAVLLDIAEDANRTDNGSKPVAGGSQVIASAWAGDKPIAVLQADCQVSQRPISVEQVEALRLFAGYAGLAIANARLHNELEERVQERTEQLEFANRELESFSYSVSHDLRAPLRSIRGYATILERQFTGQLGSEGQEYLSNIAKSTERMGQLIEDLLAFSRLGRQPVRKQAVQTSDIVRAALDELRPRFIARNTEIVVLELPACQADASLLRQIFINLIDNALKYSRNRPDARVEIGSLSKENVTTYFVKDNGAGFDMRYAHKLFGVFQRLHSDNEFEGTGVGLATTQRIILRHGGQIWAEATPGEGATFYFTLGQK